MILPELKIETSNLQDRKSTRLNSSHSQISYAVFCLKKKKKEEFVFPCLQPSLIERPGLGVRHGHNLTHVQTALVAYATAWSPGNGLFLARATRVIG